MGTHSQFLQGEAVLGFARLENEVFSRHEDLLPGGYVGRGGLLCGLSTNRQWSNFRV